ncbi:hypothetical protein PILCRDRAFT_596073 [Piloderma croceum F 1598]|uniref:Uncharacterized protein n=1 Tax=Piloderma croceum (strain F 1598) TaxID=765440 RepID=A0A0C3FEP9_PILCF|nr:hypothetical protein PILCRDRAFT_596073 [Piloderma croceum F 1598]
MDPISITSSILSSLITIKAWIDARSKKDKAVKDLSTTINLVHLILSPLCDNQRVSTLHPGIVFSLLSIGEVLSRIKDHLSIWKDTTSSKSKRSGPRISLEKVFGFISPAGVVGDLKDDAALLAQHVQIVSIAMQVSTFVAGWEKEKPLPTLPRESLPPPREPPLPKASLLELIKNADVRSFWKDMIGETTLYVPQADFHRVISKWLSDNFSEAFMDVLILRIDEFGVGGVTPSGLDRFVGERPSLKEAVYELKDRPRILANQHAHRAKCQNESTPWLVWVDDKPENIEQEVELARECGIEVFQFYSTASAKAWIVANEAELRLKEESHLLRFITDNARWENDNSPNQEQDFLNLAAGEQILRFLRGRQYRSPVLVYCCFSIEFTRYVLAYERAGSTSWMSLCSAFIEAFGRGEMDDDGWEGYQAEARGFGSGSGRV